MNSGDLQHPNNGYCKRFFMLGVLLLCEGYHAYKRVWDPARGEALLVTREATNPLDKHTVAIYKEDIFVGHVLQPGSQTVAVFNSLPSSGYGRASTASTAELVDSLGVSGYI